MMVLIADLKPLFWGEERANRLSWFPPCAYKLSLRRQKRPQIAVFHKTWPRITFKHGLIIHELVLLTIVNLKTVTRRDLIIIKYP